MRVHRKYRIRFWRAAFGLSICILVVTLLGLLLPDAPINNTYGVTRPLPLHYWRHMFDHADNYRKRSCASFPRINDLVLEAAFWQRVDCDYGNIYIYAAYWDDRYEPVVRLLTYSEMTPLPKLYCQLWYLNDGRPYCVTANSTYAWLSDWEGPIDGVTEPYILTCPTSPGAEQQWEPNDPRQFPPRAISIATMPCQPASNAFAIQNSPIHDLKSLSVEERMMLTVPKTTSINNSIGVCLTPIITNEDISAQLIEWLELVKEFGADTVYIYLVHVHPNVRVALDYYRNTGFIDITDILHLPSSYSTPSGFGFKKGLLSQKVLYARRQLVGYNDCLYRSIHRHQWITILHLNEIIVPVRDLTWPNLIEREAMEETFNVLVMDKLYFVNRLEKKPNEDKVEDNFKTERKLLPHILKKKWTMPISTERGTYETAFQSTSSMLAMHNELPFDCIDECYTRYVEAADASVHRYSSSDLELCAVLHLNENSCKENLAALHYNDNLDRWSYVADRVNYVLYKFNLNF